MKKRSQGRDGGEGPVRLHHWEGRRKSGGETWQSGVAERGVAEADTAAASSLLSFLPFVFRGANMYAISSRPLLFYGNVAGSTPSKD